MEVFLSWKSGKGKVIVASAITSSSPSSLASTKHLTSFFYQYSILSSLFHLQFLSNFQGFHNLFMHLYISFPPTRLSSCFQISSSSSSSFSSSYSSFLHSSSLILFIILPTLPYVPLNVHLCYLCFC